MYDAKTKDIEDKKTSAAHLATNATLNATINETHPILQT